MKKANFHTLSLAYLYLGLMAVLGILAPILANDKPLIAKSENAWHFPFLREGLYEKSDYHWQLNPPIPYGEGSLEYAQSDAISPFDDQSKKAWNQRHWLGTDQLGRDVLTQLIYGCRTAFWVGLGSMLIAFIIGIAVGGFSAYLGDGQLSYTWPKYLFFLLLGILSIIAFTLIPPYQVKGVSTSQLLSPILSICLLIVLLLLIARLLFKRYSDIKSKQFNLPLDLFLNRLIELIDSLPSLLLVIALSALIQGGVASLILIIGLTAWTGIAKLFRAEVLKIKNSPFISSAQSLGFGNSRILFKHILPNALPSVTVAISFGVSSAILAESSLSFLGLGLSGAQASWGAMIASARVDLEAWWVLLFPALAIFLTLLSCHTIGKSIMKQQHT